MSESTQRAANELDAPAPSLETPASRHSSRAGSNHQTTQTRQRAESRARSPPETWSLTGIVRDAATQAPCPGFRVVAGASADARCDEQGRFVVQLNAANDPRGSRRVLHVYDALSVRCLTTSVVLEPGLVLRVEARAALRGRVVDTGGVPVSAEFVVIDEPIGEVGSSIVNDADSSFFVPLPDQGVRSEVLELTFTVGPQDFTVTCPTASLLRPAGAEVVLDLCETFLRMHTSEGDPVLFADVWLEIQQRNAEPERHYLELATDPLGRVALCLERDLARVSIAARPLKWRQQSVSTALGGFAPWGETLDRSPCESTWDIPFHRLGPEDVISGHLLLADGSAAQGGTVVCSDRPDVFSEFIMAHSEIVDPSPEGMFSIPWPRNRPGFLLGGSDRIGWTKERSVVGGDRDVELRLDSMQRVFLTFVESEHNLPFEPEHSLSFELALEDGRARSGQGVSLEHTVDHIPAGKHRLGAFDRGLRQFALADLVVLPGQDLHARIQMQHTGTALGKVVDEAGLPLRGVCVSVPDSGWPTAKCDSPFASRTRVDGRFELYLGDRAQAVLELSCQGREPVRVLVEADTPETWTLP